MPKELENYAELNVDGVEWWSQCPLSKLDFTNNNIRQIPGNIFGNEKEIQVLRFINNKLEYLPGEMFLTCPVLKSIDFTRN